MNLFNLVRRQPVVLVVGWLALLGQFVSPASLNPKYTLHRRQTPSFYPIKGFSRVVERRSITTLQADYPDIFNLLILAWSNLQKRDEALDLSYYQVAGIHGFPYIPWQYPASATKNPNRGYCTHASAIFLSWHRPYLLLIEQLLHDEAVAIAANFTGPDAARYQAAADDVRLPYWDWASKGVEARIPPVVQQQNITVTKPCTNGTSQVEIPNPLYHYRFLNPQPSTIGLGATTVRGASSGTFDFGARTRDSTFRSFQNTEYNDYQDDAEGVHNGVHVDVGRDMARVPTSAFDPIFWLHHTNVDRLWAMFQAIRQTTNLLPEPRSPTFALESGGTDDVNTPLFPFRNPNAVEWTTAQILRYQSIFAYGYSYPEVPQGLSEADIIGFTSQKVNELYGPSVSSARLATPESGARAPNARREWAVNVIVSPAEVGDSAKILFYLGENADPVGEAGIFSAPGADIGAGRTYNFSVPLTTALVNENVALAPESTVPELTRQLRWVIERVDGVRVPPEQLSSLTLSITSSIVAYSPDPAQLPTVSEVLTHVAPTTGKSGGLQPGDEPPVGNKAPANLDEDLPTI